MNKGPRGPLSFTGCAAVPDVPALLKRRQGHLRSPAVVNAGTRLSPRPEMAWRSITACLFTNVMFEHHKVLSLLLVVPCLACSSPAVRNAAGLAPTEGKTVTAQAPLTPATLEALVQSALAQAEKLSGRPPSGISVIDAAAVDWPDGSGGCPQPGMGYTQAVVPGYRIRIRAGTQVLNYHATRFSVAAQFCPTDRVQPALPPRAGIV